MADVYAKLLEIQRELKCEKGQTNKFGGYQYRSKEDILEAVKPLAHARDCTVVVDDRTCYLPNGWVYIESTAELHDVETGSAVRATAQAREPESKKGMDTSQITGTAASYAGKRALGNLFAIDDTKDADSLNDHGRGEAAQKPAKPKAAPKPAKPAESPQEPPQAPAGASSAAAEVEEIARLKKEAVEKGVKVEGINEWYATQFGVTPVNRLSELQRRNCLRYLRQLVKDAGEVLS